MMRRYTLKINARKFWNTAYSYYMNDETARLGLWCHSNGVAVPDMQRTFEAYAKWGVEHHSSTTTYQRKQFNENRWRVLQNMYLRLTNGLHPCSRTVRERMRGQEERQKLTALEWILEGLTDEHRAVILKAMDTIVVQTNVNHNLREWVGTLLKPFEWDKVGLDEPRLDEILNKKKKTERAIDELQVELAKAAPSYAKY